MKERRKEVGRYWTGNQTEYKTTEVKGEIIFKLWAKILSKKCSKSWLTRKKFFFHLR
jgi:hypothetical protein